MHRRARGAAVPAAATAMTMAVVFAAGLVACSGGSAKSSARTTTSTTRAASAGPSTSGSTAVTPTTTVDSAYSQLVAKAKNADVKITYATAQGTVITLAQNGVGNSSFVAGNTLIISDGTNVTSCEGTALNAVCTDLGAAGGSALAEVTSAFAGLSTLGEPSNGKASTETIAGRSATCVTFNAATYAAISGQPGGASKLTKDATVTSCVDDESGFALKIALTDKGQTVNEYLATKVGPSSPNDFVPPSTPITIPGLNNTTTVPGG